MRSGWKLDLMLIVFIGAMVAGGSDDIAQAELERRQYCTMHALYLSSGGLEGWPDYAGTYAAQCASAPERPSCLQTLTRLGPVGVCAPQARTGGTR